MSASPETLSITPEDALSLVQAQNEASAVIFGTDNPVDVLRAIHKFMGSHFSSGHLGIASGEMIPVSLRIVAEGSPSVVRTANRRASLDDYPHHEQLDEQKTVFIPDVNTDDSLSDAVRQRLRTRSVRAALVVPLVARERMTGLLALFHTDPVLISPPQLQALGNVANQLAVVLDNRHLLETAQASAAQANTINSLVTRFQSTNSVEELLRLTLTELGQALGAERGAIRVGNTESTEVGGTAHD
jgi:GAF domain-containing protein